MYDKWYPVDTSSINLNIIEKLNDNFQKLSVSDTVNKEILNELIARNIKARKLREGLKRCQQMKQLYKNEGSAYFASAFIYNLQKKYPFAIVELQQEITVSNDKDLNLIVGVMKRKARRDKILID